MTPSRILCTSAVAALALGSGLVQAQGTYQPMGALSGYTQGYPLDRRPIVSVRTYSSSPYVPGDRGSLAPAIFMTSINYPGIYGAYSFGVAPMFLNREPIFYPARDPRQDIPELSVTLPPYRDADTANGVATLRAAPPSYVPDVPGERGLSTVPGQEPAAPARISPRVPGERNATVVVRVPDDAILEFEGMTVGETGRVRRFTTPALEPGQKYYYDVRATWAENGHRVVKDRRVAVYAGRRTDVDFLEPAAEPQGERQMQTAPPVPGGLPRVPPTPPSTEPAPPASGSKTTAPPLQPTLPPRRPG